MDIASLLVKLLILFVLIYIAYKINDYWNNPGDRPKWINSLINLVYPVTFNKLSGLAPNITSNVSITADPSSNPSNCAANCAVTVACNGFIWNNSSSNCTQISTDFGTLVMLPTDSTPISVDTYIKSGVTTPKWGFLKQATDYAFDSNLANQQLGTMYTSNNSTLLALACATLPSTSNCAGFSLSTTAAQGWLVNSTANTASTANVTSYSYGLIPNTLLVPAGF